MEADQIQNSVQYQKILEGKKKIMSIPLGNGINRHNAFNQVEQQLWPKFLNIENTFYVDIFVFKKNGSEYKG